MEHKKLGYTHKCYCTNEVVSHFLMVMNSESLFTLSSTGVKHEDIVHILDFDGPKQTGRMQ